MSDTRNMVYLGAYNGDAFPLALIRGFMSTMAVTVSRSDHLIDVNVQINTQKNVTLFDDLISTHELRSLANRVFKSNVDLIDHSVSPYSDGKIGFLGTHLRLTITVLRNSKRESVSFFVKSVPYDVPSQAEYVQERGVFSQEADFYRHVLPELQRFFREPCTPTCYMVKDDFIVFEELTAKGFTMRDRLFDEDLVMAGLSALARLHAASLCAEHRLGKQFKNLYPQAFQEKAFCRTGEVRQWFEAGVEVAVEVAKENGLDFQLIPILCDQVYAAVEPSSTKMNVISHGDLWANNLMFNEDVSPKCLLVDFQLMRYCPVAHDVAQFLHLCTTREYRDARKNMLLQWYYKMLTVSLDENGYSSRRPSWSELEQGMKEQHLGAVITAVMYFPTVLLDKDLAAELMRDPASYTQYVFRSRSATVLKNMKKDLRYGQLIQEAVTELVEFGPKLDELPKPS